MGFKTIGGFLLAIWSGFDIVGCFFVLGSFTLGIFIGAIVFGLDDTGINNTSFASLDDKAFGA